MSSLSSVKIKMQNLKEEYDATNQRLTNKCNELEIEKSMRLEKEQELIEKLNQLQKIELSLEDAQIQLQNSNSQLLQLTSVKDEYDRERRALESRQDKDGGRKSELETILSQTQNLILVAEEKYEKLATKLILSEKELGEAEERAYEAERKLKNLETELHVLSTSLKSLQIHESKAFQKNSIYEMTVSNLKEKTNHTEERNQLSEQAVYNLQKHVDALEEEISKEKNDNRKLKEEFDSAYQELHNI